MNHVLDLLFERTTDIPPETLFRAWTDPTLIVDWFTPAPWKTVEAKIDLKPGGQFYALMESPEGERFPMSGCYLEIEKNKKIVWTDCLTEGFRPSLNPFVTATITFESINGMTHYKAVVQHKDVESRKRHESMEFEKGWGLAFEQMIALVKAKNV